MLIKTNPTQMRRGAIITAIAALTAASFAFTAPAHAAGDTGKEVQITIDAYDLESQRGVNRVYQAFQRKAERACDISGHSIKQKRWEDMCAADLVDDFVVDLNNSDIFAIHYNGQVTVE